MNFPPNFELLRRKQISSRSTYHHHNCLFLQYIDRNTESHGNNYDSNRVVYSKTRGLRKSLLLNNCNREWTSYMYILYNILYFMNKLFGVNKHTYLPNTLRNCYCYLYDDHTKMVS